MAKFSSGRFPPGFFDLPQGAGEALPLDVIERWTKSPQTRETARAILAPHTLVGIVASSDAAGLTRLTRERPLVEILAMVNRPKELVHAWGVAVGGRPLGVWAADNTQMFYGAGLAADRVLAMLLAMLDQVAAECEVQIGLCVHRGQFFELAGGVYGPDADRVEVAAEEHTEGGELLITDSVEAALGDATVFRLTRRLDLAPRFGTMLRVEGGPRLADVQPEAFHYPAPFTEQFYEDLSRTKGRRRSMLPKPAYEQAAVVLIEREREDRDIPEVAVLNDLALTAAMKRIGGEFLRDLAGTEIKNAGQIGIYTFPEAGSAVSFAEEFRRTLQEQGIQCRIGVDQGPVLTFDLGHGQRDIAGSPVNIASKLAQDVGEFGSIYVSDGAWEAAGRGVEGATRRLELEVSDVRLGAVVLP